MIRIASDTHGKIHVLRWDNYPEPFEEIVQEKCLFARSSIPQRQSKKKKARDLRLRLPGFGNWEGNPLLSHPRTSAKPHGSALLDIRKHQSPEARFFISLPDISRRRDYTRPAQLSLKSLRAYSKFCLWTSKLRGGAARENRPVNPANSFHIGVKGFRSTEICVNWSLLRSPPREGDRASHDHFWDWRARQTVSIEAGWTRRGGVTHFKSCHQDS
ncbi:hypothetical protein EAF00_005052 [Botryotinia globosa]|nr:hypothetical protein EAF00_005052 [Botryotinia globosa]